MKYLKMTDVNLTGRRVMIREDLNVPIINGLITSDQRLRAALPALQMALEANAAVILLSHLGRPTEGVYNSDFSLRPVADYLEAQLDYPVRFVTDYLQGVEVKPGELVLCENVRFNVGEKKNDEALSKQLASLCDIFVMDAFGAAHRAHASTSGVVKYAPVAVAGPLLVRELEALHQAFEKPEPPILAIVGGAKISTKLSLLKTLVEKVDYLIPGGGIANTFLKASGYSIGKSLCEDNLVNDARDILLHAEKKGCKILLPTDIVVGKAFSETCPAYNKTLHNIAADDMIMDIGPETIHSFISIIDQCKTIIWNGPIGVFEFAQFAYGTRAIAIAIALTNAFSIAGGGDTLAAIDLYNLSDQMSYVSTGGGAFLEYLEGKILPAVAALEERFDEKAGCV